MAVAPQGRSLLRKLAGNTAIGFAGSTIQKGLTFATTLVLARGLGDVGFGLYSYVIAYMFFFGFVADLGMERVITREVARTPHRAGELIGNAMIVKLGLSLLALLAALGFAYGFGLDAETRYCIVLAALGLPLSIELIFRGYFQTRYELKYTFVVTVPATLSFLGVAIVCVHFALPVHDLFLGALLIGGVTLAGLISIVRRSLQLSFRPHFGEMGKLLRDAASIGLFILLFMMSLRLDQVMLFHLRNAADVGLYSVAVRATEALILVPDALLLTVFPLLASTYQSAPERFHQTYRLSFRYLTALIVPVALVFTLLRRELVTFVFGPHYAGAADSLAILSWNLVFGYVGSVYLNLFIVQAWHRLLLVVSGIAVVANVVCNLLWIPAYGPAGAAAATVFANLLGFLCWCVVPLTRPYMIACLEEMWKPALAASVAMVLWLSGASPFVLIPAMLGLYAFVLWMLGGVGHRDIVLLRRLFAEEHAPATVDR